MKDSELRDIIAKKTNTFIVDIDGTLALKCDRDISDYSRVGEDLPNIPVVFVVRHLGLFSTIVLVSGREESCRWQTEMWLHAQQIVFHELFMRKTGDCRPDTKVKMEIYENHILGTYSKVIAAIDDRPCVLRLWESLGIYTFNVNNGRGEF